MSTKKVKAATEVTEINLENAAKDYLSKLGVNEKEISGQKKEHIYVYPENIGDINSKAGKNFRSSLRRKLENFVDTTLVFNAYNRVEDIKENIEKFDIFYAANYRINDYSVGSLSNKTEDKQIKLTEFLRIVKQYKGQK